MNSQAWSGAASWGEAVAATQQEKLTQSAPLEPRALAAAAAGAITRAKGFGRGTSFHPVTGTFTDPAREAAAVAHSASDAVLRGNLARDRQLRHLQSYDLLNGRALVPEPPLPSARPATESLGSRVPYNILSGQPLPDLLLTRRAAHPRLAAAAQAAPPRPLFNHAPSLVRRRAIDPVSGRHVEGEEAKSAAEAAAARERAQRRFWQTRNFDPLLQRYEDAAKDAAYEDSVRAAGAAAGVAQAARLPAAIRYTQGRAYDSVGHYVKDGEVLGLLDTMANRPLRRLGRLAVEERLSAEGEAEAHLREVRRQNTQRAERARDLGAPAGYDLASALPAPRRPTLAGAPLSAWARIERDLGSAEGEGGGRAEAPRERFAAGYAAGQTSRGRRLEPLPGVGLGHTAWTVSGGGGGGGGGPPPTPMRMPQQQLAAEG